MKYKKSRPQKNKKYKNMSNKVLLLSATVILIILIVVGIWYYMLSPSFFSPMGSSAISSKGSTGGPIPVKQMTAEEKSAAIKKMYPTTIQGVINFLDSGTAFKTTLTATDGKEYTFWPDQPRVVYESLFGVKNGQKVEVQVKVLDNNKISVGTLKPI